MEIEVDEKRITIRLTAEEIKLIWVSVDGTLAAGGGDDDAIDPMEAEALRKFSDQLLKHVRRRAA